MNGVVATVVSMNDETAPPRRWECRCQQPAVLLATYEPTGRINIKSRDRYWHVEGLVRTTCPRCGAEHVLDLRSCPHSDEEGHRAPSPSR